jgi:hypothetical protein
MQVLVDLRNVPTEIEVLMRVSRGWIDDFVMVYPFIFDKKVIKRGIDVELDLCRVG